MKQSVWAFYYHILSIDGKPQHGLCPTDSWCEYKKTKVTGENYTHKNSIPIPIMEIIQPIFRALGIVDLQKKFVHV